MSLLDKYTEKYGNREQVNRLRKSKEWMPETPTSPEKESNRAAAHSLIDNMTDEDKKRIEGKSTLGQSLGMQTNGPLGQAFSNVFSNIGFGKNNAQNEKEYQTYKAASDILQAEKYEKKRENVVRQNGAYAYKTMKNYIDLIDKARQSRQGGGTLGALINAGKTEDLQKQAKEIKKTLEQMGITGKDFDKYEQYVREYKDIESTQKMQNEIKDFIAQDEKHGFNVGTGVGMFDANRFNSNPLGHVREYGLTAADVAVSPITGLMATVESFKRPFYADPSAPVNTYSDLYALLNASNAIEEASTAQHESALGQKLYGVGVSTAKSAEAMLISRVLGGALGYDASSKLGQLTTLPMFGASAFAQTLQESQAKGFSPEMATQKALASGMAEMLFEELSLDKAWGTLKNAKIGKGGLSKRILDVLMGAGIEGSEEIFTDLANHIADNFINGDFSDYQSGIRMRVENGMSLDQATREAKKEFIAQLVESGLAGAASGGFMNVAAASVGSVQYHNTARNINENAKLKSEVVESAKGLEGTTAAEIANSKSVEEINENDMVEILHSMEEVTQKSAHDIAKESLINAGETAEEAEKKANEIVIMSEQTQPTEAEEKRNIDLVKDENVANAYADVLKNRVASNVLEDVEKHNAEVKKIKDRVKGKEGFRAGYNNQEIKVYDFEDVEKGIVATSQGLLDLSEITLPDDMRLLFKNAHALENTKAANAFIDGYKGQSPSYYATGSLRAFMAGASGGSWESFINSKNPLNIKLIEEIGDNAYLKSMYFYGQNSRENAETATVDKSKINPGKVTGENELNPLLEPLAKKFNVAINTTEGRNKAAGSFVPSELLVTLNKAESNNMLNSVLHETLGEYTKAYAPDAYKLTKQKVIDFARKVFGDTEVDKQIRVYQNTYKGFGKQTGNTAESNKTFADASDEWFNDFMAGLAQTEYGLERVVNYVAEDTSMTATEKTSVLQSIKDIVKKILDTIKSYLQGVKSNNIGTKAAKEVEKNINKYMADLEDIFNAVEKMCNAAIAEVNKQIAGEVEKAVKEVTEDYTETEHKQFSLNTDVESTKELMALHALNEESFLKTLKLGGFACPSIAIKKKYMSHSQFGDITVVFGKATIDPEWAEGNNVYSGDAWTPVFPTVEYKLNDKKRKQVADKITEAVGGYDVFRTLPNPMLDEVNMTDAFNHRGIETYKNDRTMQYAYLNDTGKGFDIPTKENQFMPGLVSNEALRKIAETIGADTINEAHDSSYSWYESHPEIVDKLRELLNEGYRNSNKKPFADKADSELKVFQKNFQEKYKHWFDDEEGKLSWINYNKAIDALYAINKYGAYQVRDDEAFRNMLDEKVDETGYTEWLEKLFDGIIEKEGIRNNLDYYDSKGEPRTFNALHYEVTLENAVKVMKQQSQQGGTNTPFGAMQIWGVATRKFDSLEDIKKASARLVLENDEEREALREEYTQRFFDIAKEISDKKEDNQFIAMDRAGEAIVDSLRGAKTERAINNTLKQYSRLHITDHTAADVLALYNDIADMPTDYFEAKPTRAVGLNEIAYVVIPDNSSERLIKALDDNGITYKTYEAENEEDRLKVVQENASEESGTVFSLNVETKEVEEATEKLNKQIDNWLDGKMPKDGYFDFGMTPYVLQQNGANKLPVTMNEDGIYKFTTDDRNHLVSLDVMRNIPKALTRPMMVFNGSVPGSLAVIIEDEDKNGEKVLIALHLEKRQKRLLVNRIASVYGKNDTRRYAIQQIEKGNLLDIDKKRSIEWLTNKGLQLPELVQANINASKDTIAQIEQQSNNSYSLNVDSTGSSLSPEQAEFFKDSKARDDEGRLLVMYHGTDAYKEFTVFKPGKNGYLGKGMYFTEKKYIAEKYAEQNGYDGRVYQVYLNVKNPLVVTSDNPALEILGEKVAARRAMENSYSTRWLKPGDISKLKAKGYDGIIWKYGKSPIEISVWEPNQVKNTDNLKPTENEDIRYSLDVEDWEKDFFAEMTGNTNVSNILTEGLKSLDNIKLNKKITDKIAREVREEYKSRIKVADLSDSLEKVFSYMLDTGAPSYGDLVNIMKEVAMPVVKQATEIMPEEKRIWDDFKEKMKGYRIKLNPQQKAEVANTFGTYYAFKNDMFGNVIFSESGTDLDSIWTEICDASGGYLDYAENPANQPMALYEFVEALKPTPANIYGANQEEAAYDVALTIFRKFLVEQEYENNPKLRKEALKLTEAQQTYKKRIKENYDKKFKEATESLRREKEINMKRLATEIKYLNEEEKAAIEGSIEQALILRQKRQYEWRLQKLRETKNDEINRKLSELKARQRASISRRVEGRQLTLAKAKIRKNVEKLNSMLAHGTENRHIPKNMVLSTIAMLESIDINTGNSKGMAEYLQKMEDIYRGFKDSDVYTDGEKAASFDYDERTAANIEALRKLFDGRNYTQLSLSELQQVIDITNAVITQAENANKLLGKEKREYATDVARAAALEVRNAKVKDSRFMTNLDHYMTQHLNAYREFRKLSGYEDGKLMDLYYDLDKGQQKQLQVMKDINAIFDDVLKDRKEVKRLTSTDKKDLVDSGLKDENGKPVMITRAERLSLIMHSYNKSNMQHLLYGGISVPDLSYKDPKQQKAHAKTYYYESQMELRDAILDKNANKLDLIEQRATMKVKELEKQLSDWEKQFLEATKEMFWKTTGRLINETSLELKGYTLARVANYFPIKTDTDYTKSDVSGLIFDGTIEGMGFLKERRFGRNAMMLEDITDTILRQTQSVAKYVGLAIPVRNFNMVWNTVTRSPMGNADTLKKAISLTWGAKNTDYIVNLMKDLNGRRDGGELSFLDELRGKFAGAVLTLNPSVAIKQAASFFTAGAKVGNLTLAKTLKDLGKGFILKKGIPELEAINPLLWYRNQGNATQELADMKAVGFGKNLPIWAQKALNWVQFMDTGTVRTLEYAAKNYVDANFKDLKGAEYWQKVSDVFTSIVEETQPNYTVLQQADIIRNPNRLLKAVVMFKTQPLQNFGTVYDAVGEYAAKVRKGNKAEIKEAGKHLAWALSSQIASAVTFSAMTILADMILHKQYKYKDDDDKFSWLNVLAKFGAGVRDCFLGAMLFAQELYEAFDYLFNPDTKQYYGMDVSFLGQIEDIFKSVKNLNKNIGERADAITEADRDKYNNGILKETGNLVNYIGQFSGIPLGNIKNMAQSLILYAIDASNGTIGEAELSKDVPNQYERMYDALQNKDSERYNTLFDEMVTKKMRDAAEDGKEKDQEDIEKSVETSAKKYIKDGYNSGELTYDEAYTILTKEFGMEEDDAYFKLDEWLYKSEGHEDYTRYIRLSDAVNGQGDIQAEIDKLKAQGIEEDTIKSQLTGILKEGYYKGSLSNGKITQVLKEYEDLDENDIYYKFKEWDFKKTHPDESFSRYDAMNNAIKEVINGSDNRKPMIAEIKDLMKHGVEAKSLQSQLTKEYKPLYLELKAKGKASTLKNILISAYMATGLSQEDAAKRIDKWKENDK